VIISTQIVETPPSVGGVKGLDILLCPAQGGVLLLLSLPFLSVCIVTPSLNLVQALHSPPLQAMERRRSLGSAQQAARGHKLIQEPRGSVINYPSNPRFHPSVAFKIANTSKEMEQ
jgi:hypothetical protein